MDKFFKHFGINLKKNSSDHDSTSTSIPQELNESTLALSKDKYCGWSALIDFPNKYSSRRNSEIAHRLASHDLDCDKFLNAMPDFNHRQECREHIYLNSTRPKFPRTRASICFDSIAPKLLDFYSDPADLKVECAAAAEEVKVVSKTDDVFSEDEDYTVPYQPNSLQRYRTFGSDKELQREKQENIRHNRNDPGKLTSTSNLCLSKYKIRKCSDLTYDEPWDLNHTQRNLVGKLEATFSSNPALRPVNSDEAGQVKKMESPSEVQKRKLVRAIDASVAGRELSSRASHENVPNQIPVPTTVNPVGVGVCHCRHPSHRLTWQGAEQMTSSNKNSPGSDGLFPGKHKVKTPPVPSPRQQIKISIDALDNQRWYHGELGRLDAENLLKDRRPGSFLVRTSESNKKDFSLSLMSEGGLLHIKIVKENNQYILGQFSQPFESIPSIIKFFTVNKLPVKGTHHILLSHPVDHDFL